MLWIISDKIKSMPKFTDGTYVDGKTDNPPIRYWVSHCHKRKHNQGQWEYSLGGVRERGKPGFHFGTLKEYELELWNEECKSKAEISWVSSSKPKMSVITGLGSDPLKSFSDRGSHSSNIFE